MPFHNVLMQKVGVDYLLKGDNILREGVKIFWNQTILKYIFWGAQV